MVLLALLAPGINPALKSMKKIIIACGVLTLFASTADAQTRSKTTVVTSTKTNSNSTSTVQEYSQSNSVPVNAVDNPNQVTRAASDIIVPDHAYEPKGTEGVGFFGNGTGGSTMGSTPDDGGTGVSKTMQQGTTIPARRYNEGNKPQR
jgi:hypothetical protein